MPLTSVVGPDRIADHGDAAALRNRSDCAVPDGRRAPVCAIRSPPRRPCPRWPVLLAT